MRRCYALCYMLALASVFTFGSYLRYRSAIETVVVSPLMADAREYFMYAYNMRHRCVYSSQVVTVEDLKAPVKPDAIRSPGYPLFLFSFVDGLPDRNMVNRITKAQAFISALTLLISFLFFKGFLSIPLAFGASLLVALSPHLIVANSYVLTETLFCFLIVMLAWLLTLFVSSPSYHGAIVIGVVTAIAALVRPSIQYFILAATAFSFFCARSENRLRFAALMMGAFLLAIAPWTARNLIALQKVSDNSLMVNFLHHGMYPDFTFDGMKDSYGYPYRFDPRAAAIAVDLPSVLTEIARRFREQPQEHLTWFLLGKPVAFWSWNTVQGLGDVIIYPISKSPYSSSSLFQLTHWIMHTLHWPMVVLALFGSIMAWLPLSSISLVEDQIQAARYCSVVLIYFTLIHMVGAPFPRYSIPLRPFLYGMAMFTLHLLFTALRCNRRASIERSS